MRLKAATQNHSSRNKQASTQDAIFLDLKKLSGEVLSSVLSEIAAPANPLLSWFGTDSYSWGTSTLAVQPASANFRSTAPAPTTALAAIPLKSPACKKCPALNSGLCKCAMKKFSL